jgi:hypothetical protein
MLARQILAQVPHRDWPSWVFIHDRDEVLKNPRERFLISLQVFNWGLFIADKAAMPKPIF